MINDLYRWIFYKVGNQVKLIMSKMSEGEATKILLWQYFSPYDWYNLDGCEECLDDLLTNLYYAAKTEEGNLIGFFCYNQAARVSGGQKFYQDSDYLDIGLGMHPSYCGKGLGAAFLHEGMKFGVHLYGKNKFRLTVAAFNQRAIRMYEKAGFEKKNFFCCKYGGQEIDFWIMTFE